MEQILVDDNLTTEAIKEVLETLFPALIPFQWNIFISDEKPAGEDEPEGYEANNPLHVFYSIAFIAGRKEFKWQVSFFLKLGDDTEAREIAIAQMLSIKCNARTLVGYSHPNYPYDPYYSLVFINGISYLADDSGFDFSGDDGGDNRIKILCPCAVNLMQFDELGALVS